MASNSISKVPQACTDKQCFAWQSTAKGCCLCHTMCHTWLVAAVSQGTAQDLY